MIRHVYTKECNRRIRALWYYLNCGVNKKTCMVLFKQALIITHRIVEFVYQFAGCRKTYTTQSNTRVGKLFFFQFFFSSFNSVQKRYLKILQLARARNRPIRQKKNMFITGFCAELWASLQQHYFRSMLVKCVCFSSRQTYICSLLIHYMKTKHQTVSMSVPE